MIRLEMYVFGLQLCESTVFWVIMDGDAPVTQNRASHIYIIDFGGTFAPNFSQQIDCTFYLHCNQKKPDSPKNATVDSQRHAQQRFYAIASDWAGFPDTTTLYNTVR